MSASNTEPKKHKMSLVYPKRRGTSGASGQLYETKLTSLILYKMLHNKDIEQFYIGTNVNGLGEFDDVCFKFKINQYAKPVAVFLQAKHKEDRNKAFVFTKTDLKKYFNSYLNIRNKFNSNSTDAFFRSAYDDVECVFVFYTNAALNLNNTEQKLSDIEINEDNKIISTIDKIIGTGVDVARLSYDADYRIFEDIVLHEKIKKLASLIANEMATNGEKYKGLMDKDLIQTYHVLLSQKVFQVSDVIQGEDYRWGYFTESHELFKTSDEHILLLKGSLISEVHKNIKLTKEETDIHLSALFLHPNIDTITKLIGHVIVYKNNKLEFVNGKLNEDPHLKQQLDQVSVTQSIITEATEMAGKSKLCSSKFKLPAAFGNSDMTLMGNEVKQQKRLSHLAAKIVGLLKDSNEIYIYDEKYNVVNIDGSFPDKGIIKANGGIASSVGNLLVLDEKTKLLMFNNGDELNGHAKTLLTKIHSNVNELNKYRFDVNVDNFPKLSFDCNDHEKNLVLDFISNMIFYTSQASESEVEDSLKRDIAGLQVATERSSFQIKSDAIFLSYHDEIQKWWLQQDNVSYLTETCTIFQTAAQHYITNPLLAVANVMNRNKMNENCVTFLPEYVNLLNSIKPNSLPILIISKVITLSVKKLTQYFKDQDYILLDLNYILNLPTNDSILLGAEISNSKDKVFILTCDLSSPVSTKGIKDILQGLVGHRLFLVTNEKLAEGLRKCFHHIEIRDEISLKQLTQESQEEILANSTVVFQGESMSLNTLLDDDSKVFLKEEHINKIINKETIVLGLPLTDPNYEEIKDFYVSRKVTKQCVCGAWHDREEIQCIESKNFRDKRIYLESLYDTRIDERIVLVTAEPGMGKSSLLTHLSLETKQRDPKVWIVRIDLLDYSRHFYRWKKDDVYIYILEVLSFICTILVNDKSNTVPSNWDIVLDGVEEEIVMVDCTGVNETQKFEINMFLHYYNRYNIIFLIDGFDEIWPDYEVEVTKFINVLKDSDIREHHIWVTSRAYDEILSRLTSEFGEAYSLRPFNCKDQEIYIERFLQTKLNVGEANSEQIKKIVKFIEYIDAVLPSSQPEINDERGKLSQVEEFWRSKNQRPLIFLYQVAAKYFKNEIGRIPHLADKYKSIKESEVDRKLPWLPREDEYLSVSLHLYIVSDYLQNQIKDKTISTHWKPSNFNMFVMYERCIEMKLQTIRFEGKNRMDVYRPDVQNMIDNERKEFVKKHKRLAAYAIFFNSIHKLFDETELDYVKETVETIKNGKERTGFITNIINDIPRFVHMTFAEYFALEYIFDMLIKQSGDKAKLLWDFIMNDMIMKGNTILLMFDTKLGVDKEFRAAIYEEKNRRIVFEVLMNQNPLRDSKYKALSPLLRVTHTYNLHNWASLFISALDFICKDNIDDIVDEIAKSNIMYAAARLDVKVIINSILSKVRSVDSSKLPGLFGSTEIDCSGSDEDIVKNLYATFSNLMVVYKPPPQELAL